MPFYSYEAQDTHGQAASGILEASNPAELYSRLSASGFRLTGLRPVSESTAPTVTPGSPTVIRNSDDAVTGSPIPTAGPVPTGVSQHIGTKPDGRPGPSQSSPGAVGSATAVSGPPPVRGARLSAKAHALLFREFAATFRAGMTVYQAADMIGGHYKSGRIADVLKWVRNQAGAGRGFANSLKTSPIGPEASSIGVLRAGEHGGFLPYVLDELAVAYERQYMLESQIAGPRIFYIWIPTVLACFFWPLPRIIQGSAMASDQGTGAALSAGLHLYFHDVLSVSLPLLALILVVRMMWGQITRLTATRQFLDPLVLRLPIVGALQRSISLSRFLRVLAHLYRGGIPMPEAWQLSAATASNEAIAGPLRAQQGVVASNVPVSQVLAATRLFPPDSVAAVATGEQTGQLDAMLFRLADYEDQAVDRAARSYPTFMRVVMLLCMAPVIILVLQHFWTGYFNTIMKWSDGS